MGPIRTGRPRPLGQPLTGHTDDVISAAFAPDGKTLATGSADNTVAFWDLTDPNQPRPLGPPVTGHTGGVESVSFAPDGTVLATGGTDNTVILWSLAALHDYHADPLAAACVRGGGGISPSLWDRYASGIAYDDPCDGDG